MSKKQLINELMSYSDTPESREVLKTMSHSDLEELHKDLIDPEVLELLQ